MTSTHSNLTSRQRFPHRSRRSLSPDEARLQREARRRAKLTNVLVWSLQIAASAAFLIAGAAMLYGASGTVELFDRLGLGQWLRHTTGAVEFGSAVLLLYPGLATIGALLLACTMIGAIAAHLVVIGGPVLTFAVLLAGCIGIAWARREDSKVFRRRAGRAS